MSSAGSQTGGGTPRQEHHLQLCCFGTVQAAFAAENIPLHLAPHFRISPTASGICAMLGITMASNHYEGQASTNYKEAFSLFDTRGVGRVVLDKLGDLLRACGQNPTLAEINDLEKGVGGECEYCLGACAHFVFGSRAQNLNNPLTEYPNSRLRDLPARSQPARWLP